MRTTGDFGRFLAVLGIGLAVAACGATAVPVSATYPVNSAKTTSHPPAANAPPAADAVVSSPAAAAPTPSAPASTPSPSPTPVAAKPVHYGNPSGHAAIPAGAGGVNTSHPARYIGNGTPGSCTSQAVVRAVAKGGIIDFRCGPQPVTIIMTATAKVVNSHRRTVLDGGGLVTLSGAGKTRILYMNAGWEQKGPELVVQNLTFRNAYSDVRQTSTSNYGGGAIFAAGGQLKVVNSGFFNNGCYKNGPDLGGGAIRAYGMNMSTRVYITDDTFRGNKCSNGAALSGLYANFYVINSIFTDNKAIGWGANPASSGTPGGGSGGAIYTDGNSYNLVIDDTVLHYNDAREGGGAIFFVVDGGAGRLTIENHSRLHHNPSGQFQNAPGIFCSVDGHDVPPVVTSGSTVN